MKTLGEQVKAFRDEKGWNTTQMAKAVGTSRQNIESLEAHGNRIPKYLGGLAAVMERPVDDLLAEAGLAPGVVGSYGSGKTGTSMALLRKALEDEPFLPGFEPLSIPVLATAASMGPGLEQHDDVVIGRLTVSPQWVQKTLKPTKMENLRFIHGYGDSMEGTFSDGDILLVDAGIKDADVDGIYVLEANERIFIKRVTERFDGKHEITSDNPKVKTVQLLDGSQPVTILGRVIWAWNGKKL
jgi:hypothetical protein